MAFTEMEAMLCDIKVHNLRTVIPHHRNISNIRCCSIKHVAAKVSHIPQIGREHILTFKLELLEGFPLVLSSSLPPFWLFAY
jgi:hypothetical protein